jgi:hypothetical protein
MQDKFLSSGVHPSSFHSGAVPDEAPVCLSMKLYSRETRPIINFPGDLTPLQPTVVGQPRHSTPERLERRACLWLRAHNRRGRRDPYVTGLWVPWGRAGPRLGVICSGSNHPSKLSYRLPSVYYPKKTIVASIGLSALPSPATIHYNLSVTTRWCNGNTADFGSAIPGSSPGRVASPQPPIFSSPKKMLDG